MTPDPSIIFYGGSFDPPHSGHALCIALAKERFPGARILVLPSQQSAGANGAHKQPRLDFDTRLELLRQMFTDLPDIEVLDLERNLPTPNYTVNTVDHLLREFPTARLAMIIGKDQLCTLNGWHKIEAILSKIDFIVVDRPSANSDSLFEAMTKLMKDFNWPAKTLSADQWTRTDTNTRFFLLEGPTSEAASSVIKQQLAQGQSVPAQWIPDSIYNRIKTLLGDSK